MRVGGYVRLSRDEDKESYSSIMSQKSIIEECALQNQWTIYKYYEDDNCSGYTFDRPGFNMLLKDLESDKIDVVIAKDLSRIGRHNAYTLLFIDQIRKIGKRLVLPMEGGGYDSRQDESDLLGIKTWYNEMYVKDISRKIKSSIKAKQREGRMLVKEYFGYMRSASDKHKLDIDQEAAETVRRIFKLYISGLGYRKIADSLNAEGCPTPLQHFRYRHSKGEALPAPGGFEWIPSAVQRILRNDIYIGTLRLSKTEKAAIKGKSINKPVDKQFVFENNHPAIISKDQFDEVQSVLNSRKRTGSKGAASKDNIFSGLLICKECGAYMIAYNKAGKPRGYICSSYHRYGKSKCGRHGIREDTLELVVREYLEAAADVLGCELGSIDTESIDDGYKDMTELLDSLKQEQTMLRQKYKQLIIQKITDLKKENTDQIKNIIQSSFDELEKELQSRILYLQCRIDNIQKELSSCSSKVDRDASRLLSCIIHKPHLSKKDLEILIEKVILDKEGNLEMFLKAGIEPLCKHIQEDANLVPDP